MLPLDLPTGRTLRVVAIGAHCDDIEIGAGGLLRRLVTEADVELAFCILASTPERAAESRAALTALCHAPGGASPRIRIEALRDSRLPADFDTVKDVLAAEAAWQPDLVLAPSERDAHQDHRLLGELVPTAFRDALVLSYEIPKWDGDLGRADVNVDVPLTAEQVAAKWSLLAEHYRSQHGRDWFTEETFRALARLRGVECRSPYAEAFATRKLVLGLPSTDDEGH
jgi:LmbE family N-acetylglucosaminyl deacetylase